MNLVVVKWYVVGVLPARVMFLILAVNIYLAKIVVAVVTLSELCAFLWRLLPNPWCRPLL